MRGALLRFYFAGSAFAIRADGCWELTSTTTVLIQIGLLQAGPLVKTIKQWELLLWKQQGNRESSS
jgi:hypothetical protein